MNIILLACCLGFGVFIGHYSRFIGKEVEPWEVWLAFFLLLLGSTSFALGSTSYSPALDGILATSCGGLMMSGYILRRSSLQKLSIVSFQKKYILWAVSLALINIAFAWCWVLVLRSFGWPAEPQGLVEQIRSATSQEWWFFFMFVVVWAPCTEELLFRGYFWQTLKGHLSAPWIIFWTALCFGLIHIQTPHSVIPLTIFGLGLGWLRHTSQSLWLPVLAHACNNAWVILNIQFYA